MWSVLSSTMSCPAQQKARTRLLTRLRLLYLPCRKRWQQLQYTWNSSGRWAAKTTSPVSSTSAGCGLTRLQPTWTSSLCPGGWGTIWSNTLSNSEAWPLHLRHDRNKENFVSLPRWSTTSGGHSTDLIISRDCIKLSSPFLSKSIPAPGRSWLFQWTMGHNPSSEPQAAPTVAVRKCCRHGHTTWISELLWHRQC